MAEMIDLGKGRMLLANDLPEQKVPLFRKRRFLIIAAGLVSVIVLAVGLGVGISKRDRDRESNSADNSDSPPASPDVPVVNISVPANIWQPSVGATWDIQLKLPLNTTSAATYDVWDFDLFDNTKQTVTEMQGRGTKVVCYFSGGTYEDWRPDAANFSKSDLGSPLPDWPGETWLNVSSPSVRAIMLRRLDLAVSKNCDAVDPDNMDGYQNSNGLNLTQQDAIDYVTFLAEAAHSRNLSMGLKNAGSILASVVSVVQFSVNEECAHYNDCNYFAPMIQHGKPVFHIEYPKGSDTNNNVLVSTDEKQKACNATGEVDFSTVIKNMNLDSWTQFC